MKLNGKIFLIEAIVIILSFIVVGLNYKKAIEGNTTSLITCSIFMVGFLVAIFLLFKAYLNTKKPDPSTPKDIEQSEQRIKQYFDEKTKVTSSSELTRPGVPTELVDSKINEEIKILRQARFFVEYDRLNSAITIGRRISEGDLSCGNDAVRKAALAWCSRVLSRTDEFNKAEEYLNLAKRLGSCPEIEIADAFFLSKDGDKSAALNALAAIDSPASRTAALMIVAYHDSGEQAINWLKEANIGATDLDADGKYSLLEQQLLHGLWDEAKKTIDELNDSDFKETPVLHHVTALTHLLYAVPIEFRSIVLNQVPFESAIFPLAADAASMEARNIAYRHFKNAALVAQNLGLLSATKFDEEYKLWLELMDPEKAAKGKQRLEEQLRNTKLALRLVPLGLQFGIKLDIKAVEQEIDRQTTLHGGSTQDTSNARFALALMQKTPEDVSEYIAQHYDELSKHLVPKALQFLQIDMFSRAGLPKKANELLNLLLSDGLSKVEENRLRNIISEAEGTDTVEARKVQFEQTDALGDLVALIDELERKKDWHNLCEYVMLLFKRTHTTHDAAHVVNALNNSGQSEQLIKFFTENFDLLSKSQNLQIPYAWALFNEGYFVQARSVMAKINDEQDNPSYRSLEINLGIALGDWSSLLSIIANEYTEREKRSPRDLIDVAKLALHLGSPDAKPLIRAAAEKAEDNASILAAAYFLASNAGWDDAEVFQWLNKAAELSGDNGPIQKITMKDLLDQKPDWDRRESETWQLLSRGEIPMFLAAQSLNSCLVNFILLPAYANLFESDPRKRSVIPIYSGKHPQVSLEIVGTKIGIDATALYTLSYLNLIETAFDAVNEIYIPHSTLTSLFEEKQQAAFHQPSKFRDAHKLRDMLARENLEKLVDSTIPDSDLSAQIGDELALLIAEAEKVREEDNKQRIVVRSSPVHRISSLIQEEADLSNHTAVMSSCISIVEKLREKGQITLEEEKRARAYFQLQEKPWLNQPEISDGAVLYLDGLSITYFLHLGILEKIKGAGFTTVVSRRTVSEINALITYETVSDKATEAIERIRSAVYSRIESKKIKVGKRNVLDEPVKKSLYENPTAGIIGLSTFCDSVISDDRFLNQNAHVEYHEVQSPIFTTFDLLNALSLAGVISFTDLLKHRTILRRAGFLFVPITENEFIEYLNTSTVKENRIIETAELKAIRESILRIRMSEYLQLPKEALWLDTTLQVFIKVLKDLWTDDSDLTEVRAKSNWILDQVDIRGWVHRFEQKYGDDIVKTGRGAYIHMLLSPPFDSQPKIKKAYFDWIEDKILASVKEQFPELYSSMIGQHKALITHLTAMELARGEEK